MGYVSLMVHLNPVRTISLRRSKGDWIRWLTPPPRGLFFFKAELAASDQKSVTILPTSNLIG
ncbi:hypothetical protein ASG43_20780 [Aureimonas sp. Leaf454]|uniref:hypothetical protein n=1 Tax=Aureimonas sp. Leaf454 TaxID=1736381 RepID=UPI0007161856|nr:hypothetical protein [Aureimonas sp. Leaf454]KQT52011.1 hypothetical protein ASG43_20780 [Aureimonas sp. Leaf454]